MMNKITSAGIIAIALLCGNAASAADQVRVGIEGAFPPWNTTDASGNLAGLDVDLIHDLCTRAELDCKLVPGPWSGMVTGLRAGKYDAIMTVGINEERKKVIDFTTPYAQGVATFIVLADSPLNKMPMTGELLNLNTAENGDAVMAQIGEMIKGDTIGVVGSTSQERLMDTYFGDNVKIRTYEGSAARDLDIRSGRLDAGFDSGIYAAAMLAEPGNEDLAMTGPQLRGSVLATDVAIGVQKGNDELREKFDAAINAAAADGTIREISEKWSHLDLTPTAQ